MPACVSSPPLPGRAGALLLQPQLISFRRAALAQREDASLVRAALIHGRNSVAGEEKRLPWLLSSHETAFQQGGHGRHPSSDIEVSRGERAIAVQAQRPEVGDGDPDVRTAAGPFLEPRTAAFTDDWRGNCRHRHPVFSEHREEGTAGRELGVAPGIDDETVLGRFAAELGVMVIVQPRKAILVLPRMEEFMEEGSQDGPELTLCDLAGDVRIPYQDFPAHPELVVPGAEVAVAVPPGRPDAERHRGQLKPKLGREDLGPAVEFHENPVE